MKNIISTLFVLLVLVNSILAQGDMFEAEEIEVWEEEYAEEIVIIEDRAGTTPDEALYVVDEVVEDVTLLIKTGEDKAEYALGVKEEKIAEATLMVGENKSEEALRSLAKANNVSDIVADEVGLKLMGGALESVEISEEMLDILRKKLPTVAEWEEVNNLVDSQLSQEKKIKLASSLAERIGDYCNELAKLDFNLMAEDEHCDPEQAPEWLKEYIDEDLKKRQKEAEEMMLDMLTTCINDPRDCDCSQIPVKSEQNNCERNTRLAIRCEFEGDMSACEQLGEPELPEGIPDFLAPIFEERMSELIAEKEREMFEKFAPPECVEAGLTEREDCEELMMEKYLPPECKEAGAYSREECEALMMEIYGEPPAECVRGDGSIMDKDECEAIMVEQFDIPEECIVDGHPISEEECMAIAMPPECKEAGATSPEECEQVMREKMGPPEEEGPPPECFEEGEFIGEEECEAIMMEKRAEEGIVMPEECMVEGAPPLSPEECEALMAEEMGKMEGPPECYVEGEFIGREECDKLMFEQYPEEFPPEYVPEKKSLVEEKWGGYEVMPVRGDLVMIKNPETGEVETVTKEEAKEWVEENLGEYVEEEIVPGEEMDFLKEEIEEMEEWKEKGIPPGLEEKEWMPPGLEKEREWEEPPGWEEGRKEGWEEEVPPEEEVEEPEEVEIEMPEEEEEEIEIEEEFEEEVEEGVEEEEPEPEEETGGEE